MVPEAIVSMPEFMKWPWMQNLSGQRLNIARLNKIFAQQYPIVACLWCLHGAWRTLENIPAMYSHSALHLQMPIVEAGELFVEALNKY